MEKQEKVFKAQIQYQKAINEQQQDQLKKEKVSKDKKKEQIQKLEAHYDEIYKQGESLEAENEKLKKVNEQHTAQIEEYKVTTANISKQKAIIEKDFNNLLLRKEAIMNHMKYYKEPKTWVCIIHPQTQLISAFQLKSHYHFVKAL